MNRWILAGIAAFVIVVAIVFAIIYFTRDTRVETVEVTRGDVEVTIESVGTVQMRDAVQLTAPASSLVEVVSVIPGDEVREGDVLIQLDRQPFDEAVEVAEENLAQAETALSMLDAGDPPDSAEEITARVAAQREVESAQDLLDEAQAARAESLVLAPFDATIIHVGTREGDPVAQGTELIQIAELEEFELIVNIDEVDLPLIGVGAETRIVLEAFPDRVIESDIYSIARRAEVVGGTTVFPATVRFDGEDDLLILPGMNAEVEITADIRRDVLLLPEGSFQTVGRRTFVEVVDDGEVEQREIRTGIRSGGMVEIADGLDEGDSVVQP
jgi:multidrug efflux pump subunit AcrA (membrane-fusion protein)